jgi:hypothetical protein
MGRRVTNINLLVWYTLQITPAPPFGFFRVRGSFAIPLNHRDVLEVTNCPKSPDLTYTESPTPFTESKSEASSTPHNKNSTTLLCLKTSLTSLWSGILTEDETVVSCFTDKAIVLGDTELYSR